MFVIRHEQPKAVSADHSGNDEGVEGGGAGAGRRKVMEKGIIIGKTSEGRKRNFQ